MDWGVRVTISVWIETCVLGRWAFAIARGGRGFSRKERFLSSRNMTLVPSIPLFSPRLFSSTPPTNQIMGTCCQENILANFNGLRYGVW